MHKSPWNYRFTRCHDHLFVPAFLQALTTPARHHTSGLLSMKDIKTLLHISFYCALFDSVRSIFLKFSSSSMAMKAISCANSGINVSYFRAKNMETKQRGFANLHSWEDSSAPSKGILTAVKAFSTFSWGSLRYIPLHSVHIPESGGLSCEKRTDSFGTLLSIPVPVQ